MQTAHQVPLAGDGDNRARAPFKRWLKQGSRYLVSDLIDPALATEPAIDFSSGYVQRAIGRLPRQGTRPPWRLHQNYLRDLWLLRGARLEDGAMEFARAARVWVVQHLDGVQRGVSVDGTRSAKRYMTSMRSRGAMRDHTPE